MIIEQASLDLESSWLFPMALLELFFLNVSVGFGIQGLRLGFGVRVEVVFLRGYPNA